MREGAPKPAKKQGKRPGKSSVKAEARSPRKAPAQSRSRALVDAIFEAAIRILPKVGADGLTTTRVAEAAGVSVGSFYQYFADRDSLLFAMMKAGVERQTERYLQALDSPAGASIEEAVALRVDFAFDLFLADRAAVRELYRRAPELSLLPMLYEFRSQVVDRLANEIGRYAPGLTEADRERAAFVAVNSVMGVVHTLLYDEHRARDPEPPRAELKRMLAAYVRSLAGPGPTLA